MKKVNELYKGMLPCFGLTLSDNDELFAGGGELGALCAVKIDEKSVFLATEEFLKNSEYRDQIAFHPLIENSLKQPSQVLHMLQGALSSHLYVCANTIIKAMLSVCAKQKNGEEISSPKLLKYISGNEGADEKTKVFFDNLTKIIEEDHSKKIFSVYLKFGGKVNGREVSRQCSITSPLLEALERAQAMAVAKSGPIKVWGVEAPRKKDIELLIHVIKSAFPRIEEKGYTKGSVDKLAPYCASLFESALAITEDIVEVSKALAKQEPVTTLVSYLLMDTNPLVEMLGNSSEWDVYRNMIMKTAYNEGEGWNTSIAPAESRQEEYKVVAEQRDPDAPPADTVAIGKVIIANQVKRIPGTRQPIVTLPEEEKGPLSAARRPSAYGQHEERRGYDRESYHGSTSRFGDRQEDRRSPRDMSQRDLEDKEQWLIDEIREIERNGTHRERDQLRDMDRDLADIRRELDDRNRYSRRDDDRGRYDSRPSRPVPRASEQQRYSSRREEPRRFANRR